MKRRRGCARPSASSPSASTREDLGGTWIPDIAAGGVAWEEGAAPSGESAKSVSARERSSRKLERKFASAFKEYTTQLESHNYAAIRFTNTGHLFHGVITSSVTTLHDVGELNRLFEDRREASRGGPPASAL